MSKYSENGNFKWVKWSILGVVIVFFMILIGCSVYKISPGYRGVKVSFGKVVPTSYVNGIGFKLPIFETMIPIEVRTKKMTAKHQLTRRMFKPPNLSTLSPMISTLTMFTLCMNRKG